MRFPMYLPAYAKINLTLDVVGKRSDGFHLLRSVMQTIALHDTIAITPQTTGELTFTCDDPVIDNERNLAARAAQLFTSTLDVQAGMRIELSKATPMEAGLGGGSSDAATILLACARIWEVEPPSELMHQMAAQIGSDVPFFLSGGTALIEGRGEYVEALPDAEPLWLVLVKPNIGLSTKQVFEALHPDDWTDGSRTDAVVECIRAGRPLPLTGLFNALEPGVMRTTPAVVEARNALLRAGAQVVCMSGSGPTLFAPFRQLADAAAVVNRLPRLDFSIWLTRTVPRAQYQYAIHLAS